MFAVFAGAGMLAYFLVLNQNNVIEHNVKKIESVDSVDVKNNIGKELTDSHYIQGLTYLSKKEYDKAEYHLKQVAKDDPDYQSAQQVLESIKYLKKYDKK